MSRSRATEEALAALHKALAEEMADTLENGQEVYDKNSGEVKTVRPGASYLNAVRQFLKDNDITTNPATDPALQRIGAALPEFTDNDEFGPLAH
jgi:hypothetical protein